jgi:hypothetical protein
MTRISALVLAVTVAAANMPVRAHGPVHAVLCTYRAANVGKTDATNLTAFCMVPVSNPYQEIVGVRVYPEPARQITDELGQTHVVVPLGDLPAGATRAVRVMAWVRLKPLTRPYRMPAPATRPASQPAAGEPADESHAAYLSDAPRLKLERIRGAAGRTRGSGCPRLPSPLVGVAPRSVQAPIRARLHRVQ